MRLSRSTLGPPEGLLNDVSGLPRLLAGPILRRTEPERVCIWLATSDAAPVHARVFESGGEELGAAATEVVRLGPRCFVHLAQIRPRQVPFPTATVLGYDLGEGLADDLAYGGLGHPTFFLQGSEADLEILHGSCRLLHGKGEDAFVAADEILARTALDLGARPSALFLTGDQIYGDEVAGPLITHLTRLGAELLGPGDDSSVPGVASLQALDVYGRRRPATEMARFTSSHCDNHLMSFGEFVAMYTVAWNRSMWPERLPSADEAGATDDTRRYEVEAAGLDNARAALGSVQRVLANIPTYMIFDDHDVTDDWNLSREWREEVRATPTGRRTVANALAAFWAFQGWGNDPDAYPEGLKDIVGSSPSVGGDGDRFDDALWSFQGWSYIAPTRPPAVVLDTRTQRSFDSERGGARLIGGAERARVRLLLDQARGAEPGPILLVSPVPMFGLELQERRQKFLVGKVGPYEIDFEAWHSNLRGFVDFMDDLAPSEGMGAYVLLSGDVHYGLTIEARFELGSRSISVAQLVSSSFKHSGALSKLGIDLLGRLVHKDHERIGWNRPPERADGGLRGRVASRSVNTDEWTDDAPVFLATAIAKRLGISVPPDFRESRSYVAPEEQRSSVLVGDNNIGLVSLRRHEVVHALLARTGGATKPSTYRIELPFDGTSSR